jgi:hypothetical protein
MSKLESLKIDDCPYAFASFATKHNALVDMLAGMTGQNGVTVVIAEKNAIIRGQSNTNGSGNVNLTNVANVVGYDGRLQNVYVGANIANAWPSEGKWVTANGNITINSTGISIQTSAGKYCNIAFASISQNVALRTEAYCNSGSNANMMIMGSAPF